MNVGEKIQLLRKKEGMSQEELGQKLLVSRQTISLWETGQTFPTIDNLLRLKEIFSISIDELIDGKDEVQEQNDILPIESHTVRYDIKDAKEVLNYVYKPKRRMVINALLAVYIVLLSFYLASYNIGFFVLGIAVLAGFGLRVLKEYKTIKKREKDFLSEAGESLYKFDAYDDYFVYRVIKSDEVVKMTKIPYLQVEKVLESKNFYLIIYQGIFYTFYKFPDKKTPLLISKCKEKMTAGKGVTAKKAPKSVKPLKVLLIVFSALSLFFALFAVVLVSSKYYSSEAMAKNMWIMYFFAAIPLTSVALGYYWRKNGYGGLGNIIVGGIMAGLLIIYGSFSWLVPINHSPAHIESVESRLQIDFPQFEYIEMTDYNNESISQNYENMHMKYKSTAYFDDENSLLMENLLNKEGRFEDSLPNDFKGMIPTGAAKGDYTMLYRLDTNEFNTLPETSGKYNCIYIVYISEYKMLQIMEYEIDYVK